MKRTDIILCIIAGLVVLALPASCVVQETRRAWHLHDTCRAAGGVVVRVDAGKTCAKIEQVPVPVP